METADLLIRDGLIVTVDPENRVFRGSVAVQAGKVLAAGPTAEMDGRYRADHVMEASGDIVMPGLINLHDHLRPLTPGLNIAQGLKLDDFLRVSWKMQANFTEDHFYAGVLLSCVRQLRSGITSVVDHCYPFPRKGLDEAALRAMGDSGIRGFYARGIMTKPYEPVCESRDEALGTIRRLLEDGLIDAERLFAAPVSFRQADPDDYRASRELADELGLRVYTHIAETKQEIETILNEHGVRPIHFLHNLGFSGPDAVVVHCVLLDDSEIERLAETRTNVVHCPSNHMKLAKGVTPVPRLLEAGVNVGLGVDVMDNLWMEMRQEVLLQGLANSKPNIVTNQTALRMATGHGALALGMEDRIGSIEAGKDADLIVVDGDSLNLIPLIDPHHSLVQMCHADNVKTTIVQGRVLVEEGRVLSVDEGEVREKARRASADYISRAGISV